MATIVDNVVLGVGPINYLLVDVYDRFPILTETDCFVRGYRWCRDFEFETRFRLRFA